MSSEYTEHDETQVKAKVHQYIRRHAEIDSSINRISRERRNLWIEDVITKIIRDHFGGTFIKDLFEKLKRFFEK